MTADEICSLNPVLHSEIMEQIQSENYNNDDEFDYIITLNNDIFELGLFGEPCSSEL